MDLLFTWVKTMRVKTVHFADVGILRLYGAIEY